VARLEADLRSSFDSDPPLAGAPLAELFDAGGKRLRPALVLLAAHLGRYDFGLLGPAAAAVEVMHAATLVHDDVIDRSPLRRGRPTVASTAGEEAAILIGDYHFARAYRDAAAAGTTEVVRLLATAVMIICAGELEQQTARHRYRPTVDEYLDRIGKKTAALLSAACEIGAVLGGLEGEARTHLADFGWQLGLAFQIADDVLDYTADETEVGKPVGHDLVEGSATLPLLFAREETVEIDSLLLEGVAPDLEAARTVVSIVARTSGPARALELARHHAERARAELEAFGGVPAAVALRGVAGYVVDRAGAAGRR
jgi:geranylgeranyl pyrophosphate synthase